ncbi:hypothetical protein EHS25_005640 [Saitozyma podzolica]|uniref:Uncharacterized protein n=1 Tax=Saitozyma podzolica TaxID=1890683 RepID=A0A427XW07_9TREE|nr:hypothetical protein EHS25_005640 [Saitozyma podzolica]
MTLISGTSPHVAQPVLPSVQRHVQRTIEELFGYLAVQGNSDYLGEQCHSWNTRSNALISPQCPTPMPKPSSPPCCTCGQVHLPLEQRRHARYARGDGKFVGRLSHEVVGERYLRALGFGEKSEQDEQDDSQVSGGPFNDEQVREAQKDPWLAEKLEVRKWDDEAKVAGVTVPGLDAYRGMAINCLEVSLVIHSPQPHVPPTHMPTVAICVDGFDPTYLAQGISDGILPNLAWISQSAIHGIAGNFYLEPSTGEEKLVLDDSLLRGSTILEQMSLRGVRVAAVTAKDKLRRIIQHGLSAKRGDICFSSEYANQCTLGDNGITDVEAYVGRPAPPQYSGDLSLFVLDAGIKLLRDNRADLFYLTLSDYVQHKHAPGSKEANDFWWR